MVFTGFRKRSENGRHITYGTIRWNGKLWAAHRLSYFLINGDIPAGMLVCHACDNAGCVNPEHLWLGTEADNNRDRDQKGRHVTQTSEHNARATTTFEVAERLRRDHTASPKYKGLIVELAAKYGLNRNVASLIVQGRTYRKPPAASRSK